MHLTEAQQALLAECKVRLAIACYASADEYYYDLDTVRRLEAKAKGKSPRQTDPMGYWYGRQS